MFGDNEMTIYRNKKDQQLYTIARVGYQRYTGTWLEAIPYKWNGNVKKNING